jgi:outer membrane lipoprotein SlyB
MNTTRALPLALVLIFVAPACATTETTSTTWTDPNGPPGSPYTYAAPPPRLGQVQSIQEVVRHTEGHPAVGAAAGAVIGGLLLGGHGGPALVGAAGGAAVGATASQGSSETRTYQIVVRFDDGGYATFIYPGYSPFRPGQRVVLSPQGLSPG